MASISFPYASFEQGSKDAWAKLGGPTEAFRFMEVGYKQTIWRKGSNEKRQARVKVAMQLLKEHEEKRGSKADRQLGRVQLNKEA